MTDLDAVMKALDHAGLKGEVSGPTKGEPHTLLIIEKHGGKYRIIFSFRQDGTLHTVLAD